MNKKEILCVIIIALSYFSAGCWSSRELNELGISLIMGLDIEDDKILLTAEIVDPSTLQGQNGQQSEQNRTVKYVQGTGNTIFEAFRDIVLKFDKRVFVSHNRVLIFGEELAKRGLVQHIDELFRDREQRESANILIAKGGQACKVMGINNGLEEIPANYISELIENTKNNPKAININMIEYLRHFYHEGHQPTAGVIEARKKKPINKTIESSETQDLEVSILGSAVFNKDVLVGYLDGNETKALNFIMDNIKDGIITFATPMPAADKGNESKPDPLDLSSIVIIKNKTKNDIEIRDGNIVLKTKIKLRGSLGEIIGNVDVAKKQDIDEVERVCSKTIETRITEAVKKVQKQYGLDLFGFGLIFHRKYPHEWNKIKDDWNAIFSEADFEIEVKTDIIRTGLINTPIINKKGK